MKNYSDESGTVVKKSINSLAGNNDIVDTNIIASPELPSQNSILL